MSAKLVINVVVGCAVAIVLFWLIQHAGTASEGERIFTLMAAFIIGAVYLGFLSVIYILPAVTGRITEEAFGSSEAAEEDPYAIAHSKIALGEYGEAIQAFRKAAEADPDNRMPHIEIAKVWNHKLHDPEAAVNYLKSTLESQEWQEKDAATFMFQIASLYHEELENDEASIEILKQVVETFPETRFSANATHRLREMGAV